MSDERRVVVARHGETEWSRSDRHTGRTDLELTEHGRELARRLRGTLGAPGSFRLVLTSPLRRARETCALAGFGEGAVVEPGLAEWDYGEYEGLTRDRIEQRSPGWEVFRDGCPGGESPDEVTERVDGVIARIRETEGNVAVFAHGHLLRALAARWIGLPILYGRSLVLDTAGVGELGSYHDAPAIRRWNVRPEP